MTWPKGRLTDTYRADAVDKEMAEKDARIAALGAALATEREHPASILQCAACQRLAVVENAQLTERAEQAEANLAAEREMP